MKRLTSIIFIALGIFCTSYSFASDKEQSSSLASKLLAEGNKEKALQYYLQASKYGSSDAHFFLHYKSSLDRNQRIYHLGQAFNNGHKKAGDALLEQIFLRAKSLFFGDPEKALLIYNQQKQSKQDDISSKYSSAIQNCVNSGLFDAKGFLQRYGELENYKQSENEVYSGWILAERASRGGITGKKDNRLALQIVCRSSGVPAELDLAVSFLSENLEDNSEQFNLCDHVTSGMGTGFC